MKSLLEFTQRLQRLWPYFRDSRGAMMLTLLATVTASLTEPLVPALLKPLLDQGFNRGTFSIWVVPASLLLLFGVRGLAGFTAQYALSAFTNSGLLKLRQAMFQKVLSAKLTLFAQQSSSTLTNTLVYEIFSGTAMLTHALMSLVRDSFTLIALIGYLCFLNWKLTLIVACLFPAVAFVMHVLSTRLYRLTKASQAATDKLAYGTPRCKTSLRTK